MDIWTVITLVSLAIVIVANLLTLRNLRRINAADEEIRRIRDHTARLLDGDR